MFIPFASTTVIFFWPAVTIALIGVNVLVFALVGPEARFEHMLIFGDGLHPAQWITATFLHADAWHLLGNMAFLWCFGLIIEGKLGPLKFLSTYMAISVLESATEQILMLDAPFSGALGASGAIFGLLAMATLWAPRDKIKCVWIFFYRFGFAEISTRWFVGLFLGLQLLMAWLGDFAMSSAVLHLVGAAWGFALGVVMRRFDWTRWGAGALIDRLRQRAQQRQRDRVVAHVSAAPTATRAAPVKAIERPSAPKNEPEFLR